MLRRYELTDEEWNQIVSLLPPENSGKQGRPSKCNRTILILTELSGLPAVEHLGVTFQNAMALGKLSILAFVSGLKTVSLIISFMF